ncbi:LuxR family two component transcriptional regulator [Murinocardiopsis flavida]|uniref:LuxR family two component transcriptional regulator n=1 Tax=Murinocardiopsis flavida TaxID=645275 RepID=A0A2P8DRQ8_9ACTN|nr:response regulator transcription factor [Murinocardiopsis flavida]PSK99902.1 LuxR family two component transcriptional regulator [Murinocardiopsis flavida]
MIRVLVVDDEPMVCAHLRTILDAAEDIDVVGEANDGAEAVEAVLRLRPRVVIMDLRMPGVDGIAATERITAMGEPPVVVALTTFDDDTHVLRALRAGAIGFLVKTTPAEDLVNLVRVAADGHTVLSPDTTRRLLGASQGDRRDAVAARARIASLSERERDILGCLGEGMSNAAIAARLFLAETTVKSYVSRMLTKLDCANRTQAGLIAHRSDIAAPPDRRPG